MLITTDENTNLSEAAEHYLKWICELAKWPYAQPPQRSKFDLLVDFGNGWKKVQVKSSIRIEPSGNCSFGLRKSRNNTKPGTRFVFYSKDEVDYFFFHDIYSSSWLYPFEILQGIRQVTPKVNSQYHIIIKNNKSIPNRQPKFKPKQNRKCVKCHKPLSKKTKTGKCKECYKNKTKIEWPSNEKLLDMIDESSKRSVAKKLGVSDKAVANRLERIQRTVLVS